jgi:hypothetical protein
MAGKERAKQKFKQSSIGNILINAASDRYDGDLFTFGLDK